MAMRKATSTKGKPIMMKPLICAALAVLLVAGPAAAQQPIVIKFSHVAAPDTPKGQAANEFQRLAGGGTKGDGNVVEYPNNQLFTYASTLSYTLARPQTTSLHPLAH